MNGDGGEQKLSFCTFLSTSCVTISCKDMHEKKFNFTGTHLCEWTKKSSATRWSTRLLCVEGATPTRREGDRFRGATSRAGPPPRAAKLSSRDRRIYDGLGRFGLRHWCENAMDFPTLRDPKFPEDLLATTAIHWASPSFPSIPLHCTESSCKISSVSSMLSTGLLLSSMIRRKRKPFKVSWWWSGASSFRNPQSFVATVFCQIQPASVNSFLSSANT